MSATGYNFTPRIRAVEGFQEDWSQRAIALGFRNAGFELEGIQESITVQGQSVLRRPELILHQRTNGSMSRETMSTTSDRVRDSILPAIGALKADVRYDRVLQSLLIFDFPWIAECAGRPAGTFVSIIHRPYASFIWESCSNERARDRLECKTQHDGIGLFLINKGLSSHGQMSALIAMKALTKTINDMDRSLQPGQKITLRSPQSL